MAAGGHVTDHSRNRYVVTLIKGTLVVADYKLRFLVHEFHNEPIAIWHLHTLYWQFYIL